MGTDLRVLHHRRGDRRGAGGVLARAFAVRFTLTLTLTLPLLLMSGCSRVVETGSSSEINLSGTYEELTDQIKPIFDWGAFANDAYEDLALTTPVTHHSPVNAFKTFGNDPPSNKNLFRVTADYITGNVWHGSNGVVGRYYQMTDYDRFLDVKNALGHSYESNPGQVPLSDGYVDTIDMVYGFRLWHGVFDEGIAPGIKWRGTQKFDFYGQNGEVFTSAAITPKFGTDYIIRVKYVGLSVQVFLNDDLIIDETLVANYRIYEYNMGTNSHPLAHHFRFWGVKKGTFTAAEWNEIKAVTNKLWPRDGTLPSFPYITGISSTYYQDFNSTTKTWTLPNGTNHWGVPVAFVGGSGTAGTPLYQWYYAVPSLGTNTIDLHFPISGATGPTLNRNNYKGSGQPFNGHEGDSYNMVFCVITPVDSNGVQGLPIVTTPYYDNVP